MSAIDEDDVIAEFFAPLAAEGADGLMDDAATFHGGEGDVVITADALASGVHFLPDDPPGTIAKKALRVNLSDLVAKGAEPFGYLLALALPRNTERGWVAEFAAGLAEDQARYGIALLGGDTLRASPDGGVTLSVTAMGRIPDGAVVRRRTAKVGDWLVLTGTIGDGALGLLARSGRPELASLDASERAALSERYLVPEPPVAAWSAVRTHARAAMDISDGLLSDLAKLCRAAGVGARVDIERVPFSASVRAAIRSAPTLRDVALTGGDDYQILAAVDPLKFAAFQRDLVKCGVAASQIGSLTAGSDVALLERGHPVTLGNNQFVHF
ncbi:MAG: thiamine-phosphate kinase [Pseudomonadota bacterium]